MMASVKPSVIAPDKRGGSVGLVVHASQGGHDIGHLGAGGVIGVHFCEPHGVVRVDDQHGRHRQQRGAFLVDMGEVKPQPALRGEHFLGLLEGNPDTSGQPAAWIGEHLKIQGCLLGGGQ